MPATSQAGGVSGSDTADEQAPCPRPGAGAVARPRLTQRLEAASRAALTVLSAPAGFGKTTLLTEWLATLAGRARRPSPGCRWTPATTTPPLFWTYVVAAMRTAVRRRRRGAPCSCSRRRRPPTEAALAALLNDLGGLTGRTCCWCSTTTTSSRRPTMHDGMAFLLEHLPPQLHVVLATRADPPLPLARLRARGELVEVRAADLRFTVEEAAAYLNGPMGLRADDGRRRGAGRAHRGVDRRPAAGRAVDAGPRRRRARSSPGSPATTATSWTTSARRSWRASPPTCATSCCGRRPRAAHRPAVRRGHRTGRRQGDAGGARARQPVPRPARRPAAVVPLPPPVRRRPARPPARRAPRRGAPSCTGGPAPGSRPTATRRRRSATPWPAGTPTGPPTSWSSPCR